MLINIDSGKPITTIPYKDSFDTLRSRLTEPQFHAIVDEINARIDAAGGKIATAGWLPGHDWTGTVFEPIFSVAAKRNYDLSARFFGLIVWYTIQQRPERWGSGRYRVGDRDIGSRTYFLFPS